MQDRIDHQFRFAARALTKDFQHLAVPEIIFVKLEQSTGTITACHLLSPRFGTGADTPQRLHEYHQ